MHRDAYTATEWATLEYAIFWVFEAVAGADGKIDRNELAALTTAAHGAYDSKNSLLRELWRGVNANLDAIRIRYHEDPRDISTGLKEFVAIIGKKAAPADADDIRRVLMKFGIDVARASGGFLGFGEKMSAVERQALVTLGELLNTPLDSSV